jgi:hypothetical protein
MRKTLLVGVVLAVVTVVVTLLSETFDLRLNSTILLGVGLGAVVALVPDGTPFMRLGGFAVGLVAGWVGYLLRAGLLPDSAGGRSVAYVVTLAICVVAAVATVNRLALWSTLLGAVAMAGAFEYTYVAAPPEVVANSVSAVTSLLLTVAAGFLVSLLSGPATGAPTGRRAADDDHEHAPLDTMMEPTK